MGAVCLLVSWKVRGHSPITAQRLIEYTDYTITLPDLLVSRLSQLPFSLQSLCHYHFILCGVTNMGHTSPEKTKHGDERRNSEAEEAGWRLSCSELLRTDKRQTALLVLQVAAWICISSLTD